VEETKVPGETKTWPCPPGEDAAWWERRAWAEKLRIWKARAIGMLPISSTASIPTKDELLVFARRMVEIYETGRANPGEKMDLHTRSALWKKTEPLRQKSWEELVKLAPHEAMERMRQEQPTHLWAEEHMDQVLTAIAKRELRKEAPSGPQVEVVSRGDMATMAGRAKAVTEAFERGRAEGQSDVAAQLRRVLDPEDKNHWSLDGALAAVADMKAELEAKKGAEDSVTALLRKALGPSAEGLSEGGLMGLVSQLRQRCELLETQKRGELRPVMGACSSYCPSSLVANECGNCHQPLAAHGAAAAIREGHRRLRATSDEQLEQAVMEGKARDDARARMEATPWSGRWPRPFGYSQEAWGKLTTEDDRHAFWFMRMRGGSMAMSEQVSLAEVDLELRQYVAGEMQKVIAFVHFGTYLSKTDCDRQISDLQGLQVERSSWDKVTCPECKAVGR
jgi:hypothetical protein